MYTRSLRGTQCGEHFWIILKPVVIGDPLWDTGSAQGRLLSTLLAAIAEFERGTDPRTDRRRPQAGYGQRREIRP